jgi:type II secretory pathway pseudopilin PulG
MPPPQFTRPQWRRYSAHMHRLAGIGLLLVGSAMLLFGAALLYVTYVRPVPYAIGAFLFACAFLVPGVLVLRRAGRMLNLGRLALVGAIVVAIVIAVGTIVASALLIGRDERHKRETMADLRNIAAALEERATARNAYPKVNTFPELQPHLVPTYIRELPQRDHWGTPLRYEWLPPEGYAIGSAGSDGVWERPHLRDYQEATTTSLDCDIVFANGGFVQYQDSGPHPY